MNDGQLTNGQRAANALDGINAHARSSARQEHGMSGEHFFFGFELAGRDYPARAGRPLSAPAVTTSHGPRALNQPHGRQHR
jgi:hypothetical protein